VHRLLDDGTPFEHPRTWPNGPSLRARNRRRP
jgi:hypothetical protein